MAEKKASQQNTVQHHVGVAVQRRAAVGRFRVQHRALPGVDDEIGQFQRRLRRADAAGTLAFGDHHRQRCRPFIVGQAQRVAHGRDLGRQFAAEVAQHAAAVVVGRGVGADQSVKIRPQPGLGRLAGVVQHVEIDGRRRTVALQYLQPQRFLAGKVVVERALRHSGSFRDVLDAGGVEALAVKQVQAGGDDLLFDVWFSHVPNMTGRLKIVKIYFIATGASSPGLAEKPATNASKPTTWAAILSASRRASRQRWPRPHSWMSLTRPILPAKAGSGRCDCSTSLATPGPRRARSQASWARSNRGGGNDIARSPDSVASGAISPSPMTFALKRNDCSRVSQASGAKESNWALFQMMFPNSSSCRPTAVARSDRSFSFEKSSNAKPRNKLLRRRSHRRVARWFQ